MKIGEFAAACTTSRDTIRYYVTEGLLFPKLRGKQLEFAQRDLEEYQRIQQWKAMGFTLTEIKSIAQLYRLSNAIEPSTIDEYQGMLRSKREQLLAQQEQLKKSLKQLHEEDERVERLRLPRKAALTGIPLEAVPLLACPSCGGRFSIRKAELHGSALMKGELQCSCGYHAAIREGILCTGNCYTGLYDQPDLRRELYHDTGSEWDLCMQRALDVMLEQVHRMDLHHKVLLETNINGFFFTYHFLNQLPQDNLFVFVDKYEETLQMYKGYVEALAPELPVLYIADAGEHYPLAPGSIDVQVGIMSENEYTFYHPHHQILDIAPLFRPGGRVLQLFTSCGEHSRSRQKQMELYPEGGSERGCIRFVQWDYEKEGFAFDLTEIGQVLHTTKHHFYRSHVDGEPLTIYIFDAAR